MLKSVVRNIILKLSALFFNNKESKVLFYHDVHLKNRYTGMSTPLVLFKKHIETIQQEGFEIVADISKKSGQVKVQFDDGFRGIHDCFEYIQANEIPIEIFIVTDWIGKEDYLSKNQIKELHNSKLVSISSHTHTHPNLGEISDEEIREELLKSKQILEEIIGEKIKSVCYPKGSFSNSVMRIAKEVGYSEQYSSLPGSKSDLFQDVAIRRTLLQYANVSEVKSALKGAHKIFEQKYLSRQFKR